MNRRIDRILAGKGTDQLKVLKLQVLALRCMAASPAQHMVIAAYKAIEAKPGFVPYTPAREG